MTGSYLVQCSIHLTVSVHCLVLHTACCWNDMFKMQRWSDQSTLKPLKAPIALRMWSRSFCMPQPLPPGRLPELPKTRVTQGFPPLSGFLVCVPLRLTIPSLEDTYSSHSFCSEVLFLFLPSQYLLFFQISSPLRLLPFCPYLRLPARSDSLTP